MIFLLNRLERENSIMSKTQGIYSQFNDLVAHSLVIYSEDEIHTKRRLISDAMTGSPNTYSGIPTKRLQSNFTSLVDADIRNLFNLYDRIFFQDQIMTMIKATNADINFKVSKTNSIKTAGTCQKQLKGNRITYTLRFPESIFLSLFKNENKSIVSAGVECKSRLDCLQTTIEHELIHLIMSLWKFRARGRRSGDGIYSSHGKLFQRAVHSYFGHTDFRHTYTVENTDHLKPEEAKIGMKVKFSAAEHKELVGIIKRVNKRTASVTISGRNGYCRVPWSDLSEAEDLPLSVMSPQIKEVNKPTIIQQYPAGTKVKFQNSGGQEIRGTILRANPKTASITVEGMEGYIRVSWNLVNRV